MSSCGTPCLGCRSAYPAETARSQRMSPVGHPGAGAVVTPAPASRHPGAGVAVVPGVGAVVTPGVGVVVVPGVGVAGTIAGGVGVW